MRHRAASSPRRREGTNEADDGSNAVEPGGDLGRGGGEVDELERRRFRALPPTSADDMAMSEPSTWVSLAETVGVGVGAVAGAAGEVGAAVDGDSGKA